MHCFCFDTFLFECKQCLSAITNDSKKQDGATFDIGDYLLKKRVFFGVIDHN